MAAAISRTDLARNTREILDQVLHGQAVIVQSYGEDQIVLVDAFDYRLMQSLVAYAVDQQSGEPSDNLTLTMRRYLDDEISLAKAAELLGKSRWELIERFERLSVPLRIGSSTTDEAREEVIAAQQDSSETT